MPPKAGGVGRFTARVFPPEVSAHRFIGVNEIYLPLVVIWGNEGCRVARLPDKTLVFALGDEVFADKIIWQIDLLAGKLPGVEPSAFAGGGAADAVGEVSLGPIASHPEMSRRYLDERVAAATGCRTGHAGQGKPQNKRGG